jgi:hypothetical protein
MEETIMTDPVDRIDAARETERKNTRSEIIKGGKPKRHADEIGNDSVDISEEARDRASGKK